MQIGEFYNIKEGRQVPPTRYLGSDTENIKAGYRHEICKTSSSSYITNSIATVEVLLIEYGKCEVLKSNVSNPFPSNYRPELYFIEELSPGCCLGTCSLKVFHAGLLSLEELISS